MGQSPASSSINESDGIEFHQGKTCFGKRFLGVSPSLCNAPVKLAEAHTVLLCVRAPVGFPNITERKICIGRGLCALSGNGTLDNNYLFYSLIGKQSYFEKNSTGSTFKAISSKVVANTVLPLPPLSQQQSIVAELDKINEIIDLKKAQLKDLDLLAQSIFYDMFGDPIENPKGWEVKRWEETFDTKLGKMLDKAKQDVSGKELPYLANCNVKWGYFDLENLRTMFFSNTEIDKFSLKKGDLLLCEGGESGRCAIWNNTDRQILFQKAIHRARLKNNQVADVVYIRYFIEYFRLAGGLKDYLSKATIEHLTGEKLKKVKLPLPPLSLQQSFASKIQAIESQKSAIKQSLADVETLLASRMDYYFN